MAGFPGSALLCARLSRVPFTGAVSCSELLAIAGKAPTNLGGLPLDWLMDWLKGIFGKHKKKEVMFLFLRISHKRSHRWANYVLMISSCDDCLFAIISNLMSPYKFKTQNATSQTYRPGKNMQKRSVCFQYGMEQAAVESGNPDPALEKHENYSNLLRSGPLIQTSTDNSLAL